MQELLVLLLAPDVWSSTIQLATPIAYASLAAMICERSGVTNIALEGMLLTSAFCATIGSYFTGSALVGVAAGVAGSVLLGAIFAWLVLALAGEQIVIGAAINVAVLGLFGYLSFVLFQTPGVTPTVNGLDPIAVTGFRGYPLDRSGSLSTHAYSALAAGGRVLLLSASLSHAARTSHPGRWRGACR